jgi:hypothetical protein
MILNEDIFLEHYGIKGMKWGVRKEQRAYKLKQTALQKKENKARRLAGLGTKPGKAVSGFERARSAYDTVLTPTTIRDLVKTRSINEAQLAKADRIQARINRRKRGEASVRDNLAYYANFRYQDQFPTNQSVRSRNVNLGASFAGALLNSMTVGGLGPVGAAASLTALGISKAAPKVKNKVIETKNKTKF